MKLHFPKWPQILRNTRAGLLRKLTNVSPDEQVELLTLAIKQIEVLDRFQFCRRPAKAGQKLMWPDWKYGIYGMKNCQELTNTAQVAKTCVHDKPRI